ncbi:polysaccharide pyruvyl transferase family protein [Clostridium perfringens]|nr:polysaccharide pyruvyl transferase family protein [Clostridium perfringens]
MKICILSMQHVDNFGSLLQAYSLKKIIENLGHEVSFIDIEKIDSDYFLAKKNSENKSINSNKYNGKKIDRYFWNRIIVKKLFNNQIEQFSKFRKNTLNIDKRDNDRRYDICVIGSDEVFNCLTDSEWGFSTQLFGNVRQAEKTITYAASCGSTTYEKLPDILKERIISTFNGVSAFSVRDYNTFEFVNKLIGKEPIINLDPVVVGNFDEEINLSHFNKKLPKKYCIVYSYRNRISSNEEISYIKKFCKKNNLEIVSIGAPQMWIKKHLVLTPFEMLDVFKKSNFVITDTFHGTIFAAKYANKFATLTRASNFNKLSDLVNRIEIKNHLIKDLSELDNVYKINHNKKLMRLIEEEQYKKTIDYLLKSLGEK